MFDYKCYIVPYLESEKTSRGREIPTYDIYNKKEYGFIYQPVSGQVDYQLYGTEINNMLVAYVDKRAYLGKIKTNDIAYMIDGEVQDIDRRVLEDEDDKYCPNANYRVKQVQPQNYRMKIIFEKIINKNGG